MAEIEFLKWDSDFFKKKIGKLSIENPLTVDELQKLFLSAKTQNYKIIYLFCKPEIKIHQEIIKKFNGNLVDIKLLLKKDTNIIKPPPPCSITVYQSEDIPDSLIELTYISGSYSRFKVDKNFTEDEFRGLYYEWLKKSIQKQIADEIYICLDNNSIIGFATLSIRKNHGRIGLIAVHPSYQGRYIGTGLINEVSGHLWKLNIEELRLYTQKMNTNALKFYFRNGFETISEENIYHFGL